MQSLVVPLIGAPIDGSLGLANNLLVVGRPTVGSWHDALQQSTGYTPTGGSFGVGQLGPKRSHTATTDRFSGVGIGNNLPTKDSTLLIIYAKRDTTNRNSGMIGFNTGSDGTGRYGLHGPFSDNNPYFDYGGSTNNTTRLTISGQTWTANVPSVWLFTTGPRGMEGWRDGLKIGSNAANPSRTRIGNAWCLGTNGGAASDLLDFYFLACWGRQLTVPEIGLLSGNPFAMFQRPRSIGPRALFAGGGGAARRRTLINC